MRRPERRLPRAALSRGAEAQSVGLAEAERTPCPARRHGRRGGRPRAPGRRPPILRAARPGQVARHHRRQPVPADPGLEAPARRPRRGGTPRCARCARRLRQREGVPDVGTRHRDEARTREPRPDAAPRHPVLPERRSSQRRSVCVSGRLVPRNPGLGAQRGREERREDRHRAGAVEPLGLWRRGQADPARSVLGRDHRVQPRRVRPVAADPLRRDGGSDAGRHRRGRDDVRPHLHAQLGAGYKGRGVPSQLRRPSRGPPRGGAGVQRRLRLPPPARRTRRQSPSAACSRRPTTSSSTPDGDACPPTWSSRTAAT